MDSLTPHVKTERIEWIDTIKAICIFSVLMNHVAFPHDWFHVDFYFMVGFFFCSGYTFNETYSLKKRFAKILDQLIIPYMVLTPFEFLIDGDFVRKTISTPPLGLYELIITILCGIRFWFLPCLVSIEVILSVIFKLRIPYNKYLVMVVCITLFCFGVINDSHLPWHIDTALYGIIFFVFGMILRRREIPAINKYLVMVAAIAYIVIGNYLYPKMPFNTSLNLYYSNVMMILMNFVGVVVLIYVSKLLHKNRIVDFLGRNSLTIYILHIPLLIPTYRLFFRWWSESTFMDNTLTGILCSIVLVGILYPIITFLNMKVSWACGKSKLFYNIMVKNER